MKGILGCARMQGNSQQYKTASYAGEVIAATGGYAVSPAGRNEAGQPLCKPFDGEHLLGFVAANDFNTHAKTVSIIDNGLDIPLQHADGAVFEIGDPVGIDANGFICPVADAVFTLNAHVEVVSAPSYGYNNHEVENCVSINWYGGGAVASAGA